MTAPGAVAVLKFGGSSFATPQAYGVLARALGTRIDATGQRLAVVVSAMPGETERFRDRLHEVAPRPTGDRVAGLLTLADTVGAQLLAAALQREGRSAAVLAGHQNGLVTDGTFMWAQLERIAPEPLRRALADYEVVVVPGGQAADRHGRPTWLGKNSSDLSAVAVAVALGAGQCEIHSDVDGVYSCDPNRVLGTRLLPRVSYADAAAMSRHGAKVLHHRAVLLARQHEIAIHCRHNEEPFTPGTVIGSGAPPVSAVVLNLRSSVLEYPDHATADRAHQAFDRDGVESLPVLDGPRVAVIGGYADLTESHLRHGVPAGRPVGIPVTVVHAGQPVLHTAENEDAAVSLAQRLHDGLSLSPTRAARIPSTGRNAP